MIEVKVTISCEECGEELILSEMDLEEIANFGNYLIFCYGLSELPDGWHEEYDEIFCPSCPKP